MEAIYSSSGQDYDLWDGKTQQAGTEEIRLDYTYMSHLKLLNLSDYRLLQFKIGMMRMDRSGLAS